MTDDPREPDPLDEDADAWVRSMLANVGRRPVPIPPDVAARLDEAVAREARLAAGTVVPLTAAAPRTPLSSRVLQLAAAVAIVAVAGGLVVALVRGLGGSSPGGSASTAAADRAAGSTSTGSALVRQSGRDWTDATLASDIGLLLSPGGARTVAPFAASGRPVPGAGAPEVAGGTATTRLVDDPAALSACATTLLGTPTVPLAADAARYQGKPATVLVFAKPDAPGTLAVYVVDASCSASDVTAIKLYKEVPRPS